MKIGFVLDDTLDKSDGVQQYVLTLGRWLSSKKHTVHYLVVRTERSDVTNVHSLGSLIKVRFNGNTVRTPLPSKRRPIRELLAKEKFDVLHIQMPYSPLFGKRVIENAPPRTRIVGTFHILPASARHERANKLLYRLLKSSLRRFDAVASTSSPAAAFAREVYGLESQIIPNPVQLHRFYSGSAIAAFQDERFNLLFLGRFVQRKGVVEFIKALRQLNEKELPPLRFILCGDGPQMPAARSLAKGDQRFLFSGFISEEAKPDFLASADMAVFPSLYGESFGIVLVEAMAAGPLVVGGDNPGYRSVLEKDELLFDPRDTAGFAAYLTDLILDGAKRNRLRSWQQSHVKQFDIAVVGPKILKLYQN